MTDELRLEKPFETRTTPTIEESVFDPSLGLTPAILIATDEIVNALHQSQIGRPPIFADATGITLKCKGSGADIYSQQTGTGTGYHTYFNTVAGAKSDAISKANKDAKDSVQADIERQYKAISCPPGCSKSQLPSPLPIVLTTPGFISGQSTGGLIYDSYDATAVADCSVLVTCS